MKSPIIHGRGSTCCVTAGGRLLLAMQVNLGDHFKSELHSIDRVALHLRLDFAGRAQGHLHEPEYTIDSS